MTIEEQRPTGGGASGMAFVGCLLIGLAIGLLTGEVAVGLIGGLGVGFVLMAIIRGITGRW